MKQIFFLFLFQIGISYGQNFQNIMITDYANPNEPSIMINPANPQNIVVGENSRFYYVSNDSGNTWIQKEISSQWSLSGYISDPAIIVDNSGNFYFFHLSNSSEQGGWLDRIVCQKSTDNGNTFSLDTYMGYNPPTDQDKQWGVIDNQNNNIYVTWTQFDEYGSNDPNKHSNILFSKSTDGGQTWTNAIQINEVPGDCIDSDNTVEGATPAVGPNGEVYVSWVGPAGLMFDKSTDFGQTWLQNDIVVNDMQNSGGWDFNIPGIDRCNGLPIIKCDLSNSPHHGTIYINWSDQRNGSNNTDIWLAKSTNGGQTWSAPIRVNNDNSNHHQFLTWMDIDQTNGYLYFVFYDRRNYNDNSTDVYLAVSRDGGNTFDNIKISESPFVPFSQIFFGDYSNISVHNGIIRPVWTRLEQNGNQSLWTAILTENQLANIRDNKSLVETSIYPVPAKNNIYVKYRLIKETSININLLDETGRLVKKLISEKKRNSGKNVDNFNIQSLNLNKGIYYFQLKTPTFTKILRMIKI